MSNELKEARKRKKMTIVDVAREAGISKSHYCMIENGKRIPSGPVAVRLADLLQKDVRIFFTKNVH